MAVDGQGFRMFARYGSGDQRVDKIHRLNAGGTGVAGHRRSTPCPPA